MKQDLFKEPLEMWKEIKDDSGNISYQSEYTGETTIQRPIIPANLFWLEHSAELQLYHILIKHENSTEPSSWREPVIKRTKTEAYLMTQVFYFCISCGHTTFQEIARGYSDCPSAQFSGNLMQFSQKIEHRERMNIMIGRMQVGVVSTPTETEMGFHLTLRTQ